MLISGSSVQLISNGHHNPKKGAKEGILSTQRVVNVFAEPDENDPEFPGVICDSITGMDSPISSKHMQLMKEYWQWSDEFKAYCHWDEYEQAYLIYPETLD